MKVVKQISVFVENTSGRIARLLSVLEENNININALIIADTSDFGVVRLIVNDPDKAYEVFKKLGRSVKMTEVVAVAVPDRIGGLSDVIKKLNNADINFEYLYAFNGKKHNGDAVVIMKVKDTEKLIALAEENNLVLLDSEEAYEM